MGHEIIYNLSLDPQLYICYGTILGHRLHNRRSHEIHSLPFNHSGTIIQSWIYWSKTYSEGKEVLKKYPQMGSTDEEAIMRSLFMWHACLNIDKKCRLKDIHGIDSLDRMPVHNWLVNQSNSNPWIRKGFTSARYFRPDQRESKDFSWIPSDSPYWQ